MHENVLWLKLAIVFEVCTMDSILDLCFHGHIIAVKNLPLNSEELQKKLSRYFRSNVFKEVILLMLRTWTYVRRSTSIEVQEIRYLVHTKFRTNSVRPKRACHARINRATKVSEFVHRVRTRILFISNLQGYEVSRSKFKYHSLYAHHKTRDEKLSVGYSSVFNSSLTKTLNNWNLGN